jgi:hypothetical protein
MHNHSERPNPEELTPALRKALVELGAVIPTTPEEVVLVETKLTHKVSARETQQAFERLEQSLDDPHESSFMRLHDCVLAPAEDGLAMAARKGIKLDREMLEKIAKSVARARSKSPPQ